VFSPAMELPRHDLTAPGQLALMNSYRSLYQLRTAAPEFRDAGFSLYSQHEEDGLLLYLFSLLGTTSKTCVEICAGDGRECNTVNLILNHRWVALLFDGSRKSVEAGVSFFSRHPATRHWPPDFQCEWITRDNVNRLVLDRGFSGEVDLLSVDLDGIDYWVWESLECIRPRVVVLEFNHLWGPDEAVSVPYAADFKAEFTKFGSDYAGASLAAFVKLGQVKGYRLVGTNAIATNAFFVRADLEHAWLPEVSPRVCFEHPRAKFGMRHRLAKVVNKPWVRL
jgi:hypothetical protein